MINPSKRLTITAVHHQATGEVTGYFNELPGLVVQGSSTADVKLKLDMLYDSYIKRLNFLKNNIEIQTTSIA